METGACDKSLPKLWFPDNTELSMNSASMEIVTLSHQTFHF